MPDNLKDKFRPQSGRVDPVPDQGETKRKRIVRHMADMELVHDAEIAMKTTDEDFLPDNFLELDATGIVPFAIICDKYDISDDDARGMHSLMQWFAWAYHECKERGIETFAERDVPGKGAAIKMGLNKKMIAKFAKMYRDGVVGVKGGPDAAKYRKEFNELYGEEEQ